MIHRSITTSRRCCCWSASRAATRRCGATLDVEEVSAEEVQGWRGRPLVIDVRDRESYQAGHIPGALSLRIGRARRLPASRRAAARPRHPSRLRPRHRLARRRATVRSHGPWQVRSLRGGMAAWSGRGYELEKGRGASVEPRLLRPPDAHAASPRSSPWSCPASGSKGIYMLLTLLIVLVLGRPRDRRSEAAPARHGGVPGRRGHLPGQLPLLPRQRPARPGCTGWAWC